MYIEIWEFILVSVFSIGIACLWIFAPPQVISKKITYTMCEGCRKKLQQGPYR